jgi:hypothetical protein
MSKIHRLLVLAEEFEEKATKGEKGEYGGKGPFTLPKNHKAAMQVTKGGTTCKNCEYVDADKHECKNPHYVTWNGGDPKLPDLPLDEICSDWWEAK